MILDTNAVSAVLAGDPAIGEALSGEERHHLPVIVLGEYRYGMPGASRRRRLEAILAALVRESIVLIVDEETAAVCARVRNGLRRAGQPIPENDVWIAALALQHDLSVVSRDGRFDAVDGLRRVGW